MSLIEEQDGKRPLHKGKEYDAQIVLYYRISDGHFAFDLKGPLCGRSDVLRAAMALFEDEVSERVLATKAQQRVAAAQKRQQVDEMRQRLGLRGDN